MQYHHHRSRLPPPPPPPFGRGGGAVYPRGGHKQLYAPPPPPPPPPPPAPRRLSLPAPPPPPHRRYEVLMEAGRLAAEYLVSTGVLPPSSLQRGGGDAWAAPPPPPPPPLPQQQQQQEQPAFYGRRRYDDAYCSNPATRPRRNNSTSSSSNNNNRDNNYDYSNGGYNGRGKRKYGEYRRGHLDSGREREQEKGRSGSNGRRYEEDNEEDGAPGFRRDRRGSGGNDEAKSCVTEEVREATPSMAKDVTQLETEDILSNTVSSNVDVRNDADAQPEVQSENEDGVMEQNKVSSLESEVAEQGMDTNGDVNTASPIAVMEAEARPLLDGKVVDEEAEDNSKVLCETSLDHIALDDDMTNLENGLHVDRRSLLEHCDFAKAPTKPRSARGNRKAASETVELVSSGEASQMVVDEAANEKFCTNIPSDSREDQICQENTGCNTACSEIMEPMLLQEKKTSFVNENMREYSSQENTGCSTACSEIIEPMLLQENKTSVVNENMREYRKDAHLNVVQESKEETDGLTQENDLPPLTASRKDGLTQETNLSTLTETHEDSVIEESDLSPLIDSHNDSLIEEADLSSLADPHNDSLIEESDLSPLTTYHEVRLMQQTDLPQAVSLHEDNLNLQLKEGAQICDIEMLPDEVDLIELSDQKNNVGVELFTTAETKSIIKMEEEKMDQSSSFGILNNPGFGCSVPGSSVEPHKQMQEDFGARAGDNVSGTNNVYQVPLDNNSLQVFDIEDDTQIEVAGFDSSKAKNEMICSSMDDMMHRGIHTDDLPVIQDGYNLALSDYLVADIPCFTSMQPDLQASICTNDSEGIPAMDDPIYGSLTDIGGFMDVWGQPAEDFEKFF